MNLLGVAALLAAVSLGSGPASEHALPAESALPAVVTVATPAPSPGMTAPVLRQVAGAWQTTVIVNVPSPPCPGASAVFTLETSPPQKAAALPKSMQPGGVDKDSCTVTLKFGRLPQVPLTASLVITAAGTQTAVALTVVRQISLPEYLAIPAATGAGMAFLLLILAMIFVKVYRREDGDGRKRRANPLSSLEFWRHTVTASGVWTLNDSWATNITTLTALIATALGATAAADTLFPGVQLDRFAILNIFAAGIATAIAPLVFGILYSRWTARNPGPTADATITLPTFLTLPAGAPARPGWWSRRRRNDSTPVQLEGRTGVRLDVAGQDLILVSWTRVRLADRWRTMPQGTGVLISAPQAVEPGQHVFTSLARITAPDGAEILLSGDTLISAPDDIWEMPSTRQVLATAGSKLELPLGTWIEITAPTRNLTLPGGSDVIVQSGSTLRIDNSNQSLIMAGQGVRQLEPPPVKARDAGAGGQAENGSATLTMQFPVVAELSGDAKITVTGGGEVTLPRATVIAIPHREEFILPGERHIPLPQSSGFLVANMRLAIVTALVTIFGVGAELGIAALLACKLSDASPAGHLAGLLTTIATGLFALYYSTTALRALASPQPGSSLSSTPGTSFTL
jgi:hypothetical protein